MLNFIRNNRVVKTRFIELRDAIVSSKVISPKSLSKFVFLCGANQSQYLISARREALINFSKQNLPNTQFFLAEKVFLTLNSEGHKENILDIEHQISDFADHIVIILESNSAFAELGAFSSNKKLREKLVVINDSKYKSSKSFINLGPLKAISDSSVKDVVLSYKMDAEGLTSLDGIGEVFHSIYQLFKGSGKPKHVVLNIDVCNPAISFDKHSAMFVHDLVFLTGPILHIELVEILKVVFGDKYDFKLKEHLAILVAFDSIARTSQGFYKSLICKTYYEYRYDVDGLIATFRNHLIKNHPERIYEH